MVVYPDTSFLVPLYAEEARSEAAERFARDHASSLIFTSFHRLELRTALRMRLFRREMTLPQLRFALRQVEQDLEDNLLRHSLLNWHEALREAEVIGAAHIPEIGCRSGDLLHVASAVALKVGDFCTFDQRQAELAKRAGLKVKVWR